MKTRFLFTPHNHGCIKKLKSNNSVVLILAAALLFSVSCFNRKKPTLSMRLINSSVQKPSNVALYFAVETPQGDPVAGLSAETFKIYEDGQLISPYESKQTILNPDVAVAHHVLLLLDLSGSIVESGSLNSLLEAATKFAGRLTDKRNVGIFGFDGSKRLIPVCNFTKDPDSIRSALAKLSEHKVKDPSTNLNGAVVHSIDKLEKQLSSTNHPLRFATLVVFTDGTDRARRVTKERMFERMDESSVNVFVIGLGAEVDHKQLSKIGSAGFVKADEQENITTAFEEVAERIEANGKKFYLLSYCSPARAGEHELTISVQHGKLKGSVTKKFNARGFRPGCDPSRKPSFSLKRIKLR